MSDQNPPVPPTPPPPPPAQVPMPQPGANPPQNGMGTAALVLGIVGLFCLGTAILPSILAIVFGAMGIQKANQGLATNKSAAQWGLWLGIVGIVLAIIAFILWFIFVVILAAAGETTTYVN